MRIFSWKKISISVAVLLLVLVAVWWLMQSMTTEKTVSAEEATTKVQELYKGKIVSIEENEGFYHITIKLDTGEYEVEIDRATGDIGKLNRITNTVDSAPKQDGESEDKEADPADSVTEQPPKHLSEQEAISIALQSVTGEVDDIDLEQSNGLIYYLVEVEVNDDKEATVQINAISGEVMSITWDD
ncbi:PepSY domain-containing protein [Robertmurraya massiliosenegalensis]|uniref:PepSY domain-containing protein n=1 Tax=Robertmurraya massiliosenegalensis TaxID=1287657 RepID=UPI000378427B|nr:PepSY domain-containing protein [Robertmurraya massiliosenegalensis]